MSMGEGGSVSSSTDADASASSASDDMVGSEAISASGSGWGAESVCIKGWSFFEDVFRDAFTHLPRLPVLDAPYLGR